MRIDCGVCVLRPLVPGDVASLARHANNRNVWLTLRDRFPHPYRLADAAAFIAAFRDLHPPRIFGITVDDQVIGTVGVRVCEDVERTSGEIGYWIGEPFWGRGIATAAVRAVTPYAIQQFGLTRVFAVPFTHNAASIRVLAKAGYVHEGTMRRSAIKDGVLCDQDLFARYDTSEPIEP